MANLKSNIGQAHHKLVLAKRKTKQDGKAKKDGSQKEQPKK